MKKIILLDLDAEMTLAQWDKKITRLLLEHGKDVVLRADAGYNNVCFELEIDVSDEEDPMESRI